MKDGEELGASGADGAWLGDRRAFAVLVLELEPPRRVRKPAPIRVLAEVVPTVGNGVAALLVREAEAHEAIVEVQVHLGINRGQQGHDCNSQRELLWLEN
ncbi:hypothetical protein PHYPSEUDO_005030 [Phytophthora pseudosyringae]|uniref:Uncharacterized protein n=1 Tax=Phytophthora pseudosyringae TaxID=221518 RepID=A0A8T1VM31_9STRA|nr:hypothetical protein PHYPSEUDO_005030 [Phytophthora pseudosyringae]